MRNLPTAPARTPEPNRIDSVSPTGDGRSAYWGLDAQGTVAAYLKRLRSISVQLIVVLLANLVVMLWAVRLERYVLYLVALALTLVAAFVTRLRKVKLFTGLSEVVSQDCDPARYRAVLDVLSARDRFGRSANTIAIELAYCDYLELDSDGALRRLESVTFKRKDNVRWFRAMQIEFLSRVDAGNLEGARMALADCHQQRANWQLYLAEYELLHGSPGEAARLASDASLEPLTPRMERLRAEVLSGLEVAHES